MKVILIGIGTTLFIGLWIWIGIEMYTAPIIDDMDMKDMEGEI